MQGENSNKSPSTGETPSQPALQDSHRGSPKHHGSRGSNLTNSHYNKTISSQKHPNGFNGGQNSGQTGQNSNHMGYRDSTTYVD